MQEKTGKGNKPATRSVESRVPRREKNDGKTKTTTKSTAKPEKTVSQHQKTVKPSNRYRPRTYLKVSESRLHITKKEKSENGSLTPYETRGGGGFYKDFKGNPKENEKTAMPQATKHAVVVVSTEILTETKTLTPYIPAVVVVSTEI